VFQASQLLGDKLTRCLPLQRLGMLCYSGTRPWRGNTREKWIASNIRWV
jgi:hypothetical protein